MSKCNLILNYCYYVDLSEVFDYNVCLLIFFTLPLFSPRLSSSPDLSKRKLNPSWKSSTREREPFARSRDHVLQQTVYEVCVCPSGKLYLSPAESSSTCQTTTVCVSGAEKGGWAMDHPAPERPSFTFPLLLLPFLPYLLWPLFFLKTFLLSLLLSTHPSVAR